MLWIAVTCVILILIAFEDFKSRSVNVLLLVALAILLTYRSLQDNPLSVWAIYVGVNATYLALMLAMCGGYLYWKYRTLRLTNFIGGGDLIFIAVVSLLLHPVLFLVFNTLTFIVALTGHLLLSRISEKYLRMKTVPLAGFQSACLVLVVLFGGNLSESL